MSLSDTLSGYLALIDGRHNGWFGENLNLGAEPPTLAAAQEEFGRELPAELVELYAWRNGPTYPGVAFFITHGGWVSIEHGMTYLVSPFRNHCRLAVEAGNSLGLLEDGFALAGDDGSFVVVETLGPLAGYVFLADVTGVPYPVTRSLTDFIKINHRVVESNETRIHFEGGKGWGLQPAEDEWVGGNVVGRPGQVESIWPELAIP